LPLTYPPYLTCATYLSYLTYVTYLLFEPKESAGFFGERRTSAAHDVDPCHRRAKLANQKQPPDLVVGVCRSDRGQRIGQRGGSRPDVGERRASRPRFSLPGGRTVISIERVGVALAQREHQTDVRFRGRVQSGWGHPGVRPTAARHRHERSETE